MMHKRAIAPLLVLCVFPATTVPAPLASAPGRLDGEVARVNPPQTSPDRPTTRRPWPPATRPEGNQIRVGQVRYGGEHTWRGVVEVGSDNITFSDGDISATPEGVPQGVSFRGHRHGVTLRNLRVDGVGDGVNVGNDTTVDDFFIENCQFLNCCTPDAKSSAHLLASRGMGLWGSGGKNWTIKGSTFTIRSEPPSAASPNTVSVQYAMRLGEVEGLTVADSTFESHNGKACVWLMFVHDALFENCRFIGGRFVIGSRPGDMGGIEKGDCRNIVFRGCTFDFDLNNDWPATMLIYPGAEHIRFERCAVNAKS